MATKIKTIQYCFANTGPSILATNTAGTFDRTLYIPETGKTFIDVGMTGAGQFGMGVVSNANTRLLSLQIGANTATTSNNPITLGNSGEHNAFVWKQDMTAQFTSYWGASTTNLPVNATIQINGKVASSNIHNPSIETFITYTYDDTSSTKVKTVLIPLDCPTGNISVTNTTYTTVPALDTYLPEASKTYRNIYVVLQGNGSLGANANLHCLVGNITNTFAQDPNNLASDIFMKKIMNCDGLIGNTSVSHNFQLGTSLAAGKYAHWQAWMVVTYEYDEASTTRIMNSLQLPMEVDSPAGMNASSYARGTRELWIQEPGTITTERVAFYSFWNEIAAVGTPSMRIGTGSFVNYTDVLVQVGGSDAAMTRNDSAFTLVHGRNSMNFDVYRTDTADFMWNVSGFFIVNYTSDKPAAGSCSANKTIRNTVVSMGTGIAISNSVTTWAGAQFPETSYFISAFGTEMNFYANSTAILCGFTIRVEKTSAEGGVEWMPGYRDICQSDPENGVMYNYSQMRENFKRWGGDVNSDRVDVKGSRRIEVYTTGTTTGATGWHSLDILYTYHSLIYNVAGTVANSAGGNVVLSLCRSNTGEIVLKQNVAANGSFNFVWYDNTEPLFVSAVGDSGKYTRSTDDFAAV